MKKYRFYDNKFYPLALQSSYEASGLWPLEGTDIDEPIFAEFSGKPSEGMVCGTGSDGYPCWVIAPRRSHEELILDVEAKRSELLVYADAVTSDWRTELGLGEISDIDRSKLSAWMVYKRQVKSVPLEDAIAQDFKWPSFPA